MSRSAISFQLLLAALAAGVFSGCGPGGLKQNEVTGTVIFQGKPLEEGLIEFEPMDGQGSKSGAGIKNGIYLIPKEKGLFPGRYRVSIIGGDRMPSAGNAEPFTPPRGFVPGKERIPPKYNVKSELVREVTTDGPNQCDFNIS